MRRRTLLRCLPALAIVAAATALAAPPKMGDTVNGREVWYVCETCSKPLFGGDLAFVYWDGPTFCEAHSPTWADLKAEQDELIAAGEFGDIFEDDEAAGRARNKVLGEIVAGRGGVTVAYPL